MQLGPSDRPLPDTPLMEVADWAGANGFTALEIACWPAGGGEKRRYAGTSHIDVDGLTKGQG
jgi:sugar phosphate isomerase/epimerase